MFCGIAEHGAVREEPFEASLYAPVLWRRARHVAWMRTIKAPFRKNGRVPEEKARGPEDSVSGASETISQLLAKILNQLSLSAWLPSAALVLIVAFILVLGANLQPTAPTSPETGAVVTHRPRSWTFGDVISQTFASIGHTSFGAITLLILIIVVATMITQAFSFEAIRFLEGYWGVNPFIDRLAGKLCTWHQDRHASLLGQHARLQAETWKQVRLGARKAKFSKEMIAHLKQTVLGTYAEEPLSAEERATVADFDWQARVDAGTLRLLRNVEKRLTDYPREGSYVMATRLGNVLRRHEVETGEKDIETLVERIYHLLPFDMRLSHDEQRARLDLYCSMVFVLWLSALVAFARFGWWSWHYTASFAVASIIGSLIAYRAAIASARYYGALLEGIAEWNRQRLVTLSADAA